MKLLVAWVVMTTLLYLAAQLRYHQIPDYFWDKRRKAMWRAIRTAIGFSALLPGILGVWAWVLNHP